MCVEAKTLNKCACVLVSVYTIRSYCHSSIGDANFISFSRQKLLSLIGLTAPGRPVLVFSIKSAQDVCCECAQETGEESQSGTFG